MTKRKAEDKARYFTFLIYPESSPQDWVEKLEAIGMPMAISPIHDNDEKDEKAKKQLELMIQDNRHNMTQEDKDKARKKNKYKKVHYHVVYVAKNAVTPSSVRKRIQRALGDKAVAMVQIVDNVQGMYLYLTHESEQAIKEKKYVYDKNDIKHLNNFDIDRYVVLDKEGKDEMLQVIRRMIIEQGLLTFNEMDKFVAEEGGQYGLDNDMSYQTILRGNWGLLKAYLDGNYQIQARQYRVGDHDGK